MSRFLVSIRDNFTSQQFWKYKYTKTSITYLVAPPPSPGTPGHCSERMYQGRLERVNREAVQFNLLKALYIMQ
jgi:hypothetical protein